MESCVVRTAVGVHPKQACRKFILTNKNIIVELLRDYIGNNFFVGEIGFDDSIDLK